jgi:hypothetical protein
VIEWRSAFWECEPEHLATDGWRPAASLSDGEWVNQPNPWERER